MSDTPAPDATHGDLLAASRRLEVGALVVMWLERHPRWVKRVAAATGLDASDLQQLIGLVLTARQFLSDDDFAAAAAAERWIVLTPGGTDALAIQALLECWWTALASPISRSAPLELLPRDVGLSWMRAWVRVTGAVTLGAPEGVDRARLLAPIGWQVAGLAALAEGLAPGRTPVAHPSAIASTWTTLCARATTALERRGMLPARPLRERTVEETFSYVTRPTALQSLASEIILAPGPQLFLLEEASGGGKTEAAIVLAHRLVVAGRGESITFALPWSAAPRVVQQRALDVQGLLFEGDGRASLAPNRWSRRDLLIDDQTLGSSTDPTRVMLDGFLGDTRKRTLWAPIGGDTLEHVLLAALPSRFAALRLLALSRSVLVIDQLQAHDETAIRCLVPLLELHAAAGGSAIISTMALPRETRQRLTAPYLRAAPPARPIDRGAYPRLLHASAQGLVEAPVEHADPTKSGLRIDLVDQESAALHGILRALERGQAACWVRNSTEAAIVAYAHAVRQVGADRVILIHERFTIGERLDIERLCTSRFGRGSTSESRAGWLVIATACIEPRDLDFDVLVSDLAPIEVLLDRAGRLHRHRRNAQGEPTAEAEGRGERVLTIVAPPWTETPAATWLADRLPESAAAYAQHGTLWLTLRALRALRDPLFPEDVPRMLEGVYGEDAIEAIPHTLWQSRGGLGVEGDEDVGALRQMPLLPTPATLPPAAVREGWSTPTRLGADATILRLARVVGGVVMPLYGSAAGGWELSEVSVPSPWIARRVTGGLEAELAIAEALMPDHGRYCVTIVLGWDAVHEQWWGVSVGATGQPVELVYRGEIGLVAR